MIKDKKDPKTLEYPNEYLEFQEEERGKPPLNPTISGEYDDKKEGK